MERINMFELKAQEEKEIGINSEKVKSFRYFRKDEIKAICYIGSIPKYKNILQNIFLGKYKIGQVFSPISLQDSCELYQRWEGHGFLYGILSAFEENSKVDGKEKNKLYEIFLLLKFLNNKNILATLFSKIKKGKEIKIKKYKNESYGTSVVLGEWGNFWSSEGNIFFLEKNENDNGKSTWHAKNILLAIFGYGNISIFDSDENIVDHQTIANPLYLHSLVKILKNKQINLKI